MEPTENENVEIKKALRLFVEETNENLKSLFKITDAFGSLKREEIRDLKKDSLFLADSSLPELKSLFEKLELPTEQLDGLRETLRGFNEETVEDWKKKHEEASLEAALDQIKAINHAALKEAFGYGENEKNLEELSLISEGDHSEHLRQVFGSIEEKMERHLEELKNLKAKEPIEKLRKALEKMRAKRAELEEKIEREKSEKKELESEWKINEEIVEGLAMDLEQAKSEKKEKQEEVTLKNKVMEEGQKELEET